MSKTFISIDSASYSLQVEIEHTMGYAPDPLEILIAEEEFFDDQLAEVLLSSMHRQAKRQKRGIYAPHARSCMHNDDK